MKITVLEDENEVYDPNLPFPVIIITANAVQSHGQLLVGGSELVSSFLDRIKAEKVSYEGMGLMHARNHVAGSISFIL